ncbi:hypothetical protein AVEN_51644-1 [Araneus ventricosus]|uniref:SOCS box domain-containing protein n=1 Tax=Araneus ventricosus TaxID=182803 RepID=A0A4Y2MSU8_ARAVE|nr:hypothetical protein AVEN_51644-1 [Araneus ventricosus]
MNLLSRSPHFVLSIMLICKGMSSERMQDLYDFYSGAVGLLHSRAEPRSLKHQCRPTVRRMLCERNFWIPDGIRLTGLPKQLQSFLNLEV